MAAKTAEEIAGFEHDWLAVDMEGHVAMFSTAGGGYAPSQFLRDVDAHDGAFDALFASPASTSACLAPLTNVQNPWQSAAERGLFAFDSDFYGGPYNLEAAPVHAAHISELPDPVRKVAGGLIFRQANFAELTSISADMIKQAEST